MSKIEKCQSRRFEEFNQLFGSCTETFVLAVNILDRFLALMKVFNHFL